MSSVYVARQPIFELGRGLYGYELLYRRDGTVQRADGDASHMSADVITGTVLGIGLKALAADGLAFINFSQTQLIDESWALFEPGKVVIELLESVEPTKETLDVCRKIVAAGYRIALDDYVHSDRHAPLLEFASIVKIDVLNRSEHELREAAAMLLRHDVRLLAERVETARVRDICVDAGYEFFQGYLFSKPETFSNADVSVSEIAIMRLLNLLRDPDTNDAALEAAFQADLGLSYKLLRIVNAAASGTHGIASIGHAIRIVGRETLHRWLAVMLVASLGRKGDVSREMALTAITRARMCELVASASEGSRAGTSAFIVGLFSLLDVLLEAPMERILAPLELSDDVRSALLRRRGPLATPLQLVESYEKADWDAAQTIAADCAMADDVVPDLYVDALHWATAQIAV